MGFTNVGTGLGAGLGGLAGAGSALNQRGLADDLLFQQHGAIQMQQAQEQMQMQMQMHMNRIERDLAYYARPNPYTESINIEKKQTVREELQSEINDWLKDV